jgi:glutamate formiminotransferase
VNAIRSVTGVTILDRTMDPDHHRCVVTFAGAASVIGEAAFQGVAKAVELIDLRRHTGAHPRIGSADVVPFIPVQGVNLANCARIAEETGALIWEKLGVPVYLYEAAARKPDRARLENIRRGQFEGLREEVRTNPARLPDFGGPALHPTAGAAVVGARKFLIAFNINLNTPDVEIARRIARAVRESSGGMPCVKAMGVLLVSRNHAQVSMNLTDFETTPVHAVYEAVAAEAARHGVSIAGSEIVGLIPRQALESAAARYLKIAGFRRGMVFENRLLSEIE